MGFFRNYLPFRWRKISEFFDSLKKSCAAYAVQDFFHASKTN